MEMCYLITLKTIVCAACQLISTNILYINALHVNSYQFMLILVSPIYQFPNLIDIIITANFIINDEFKTHGLISKSCSTATLMTFRNIS